MNWVRENKFMTGFLAVMVMGLGVLGYLLYTAYGAYSEVSDQYTGQANELHRLQSLAPYPDEANLVKYRAERDKILDATQTLATNLAQMQLPVEQLTPPQFQDRLRMSVSNVTAKAQQLGVKLPDHFYMGFDVYQTQPPRAEAATALGHELAALEIAMNMVLEDHVETVTALNRPALPEEQAGGQGGGGGGGRAGGGGGGFGGGGGGFGRRREAGGGGGGGGGGGLVEKVPFSVEYVASQSNFQKVLNSFSASAKQFFIIRTLDVQNDNPHPIMKADTETPGPVAASPTPAGSPAPGASPAAAASPAAGAPGVAGAPEGGFLKFLVGTEKLHVVMQVDIAAFNPPAAPAHKGGAH